MAVEVYDVVVVGGGVVGLAILREATLHGWSCVLVERESELLTWASGANSGIICTVRRLIALTALLMLTPNALITGSRCFRRILGKGYDKRLDL